MSRRSKLEVPIEIYRSQGANTFKGPELTKIADARGLVSWGGTPYDATIDPNSRTVVPTQGDRAGAIRVFLRAIPASATVAIIEDCWILAPTMSNRFFKVTASDLRGVLPGLYPYRLEAVGN